ncbi:MAG: AAA family ATPase [Alphaproteobacteria bacterium]
MDEESFTKIPQPKNNPFLSGNEAVEREILQAISSGRIEGSWLIYGQQGIGKATLAYRMARFILAKKDASAASSLFVDKNENVFKLMTSDSHPDLKIIERSLTEEEKKKVEKLVAKGEALNDDEEKDRKRKSVITIDSIREIKDFLALTSFFGGYRIVIIDTADDLNEQAANALLKILEEPPKKVIMILISNNLGKIKPTILSRCRKIYMNKPYYSIATHIIKTFIPDCLDNDISKALMLGNGSIGLALEVLSSNGIEICQRFANLFAKLPLTKPAEINDFAEFITSDDTNYKMAKNLIPDVLSRAIKNDVQKNHSSLENIIVDNMIKQGLDIEDLLNIRNEICLKFELTDRLNLDKKLAVMDIFFKTTEVIKTKC